MLKNNTIDAELVGHAPKLDMELQSLWEWFFSVCGVQACQLCYLGLN